MPAYEYDECKRFQTDMYSGIVNGAMNGGGGMNIPDSRDIIDGDIVSRKINYWGYTKDAFYFAPKAAFSSIAPAKSDYTIEFKKLVKRLHKNGIEVIMEMYFTDEPVSMITDCIKYWVINYHIDGIHLYAPDAALSAADDRSHVIKNQDIYSVLEWKCEKYKNMADYNNGYMNTVRKFLKGEENQLGDFINTARNNPSNAACINYITNHNGFTLNDLVSYDRKHNEANGENNMDGENFNYSWNCGTEGKTRKKKITDLRQRQIKNAFMPLMLSQGTPLILAGDEFRNTREAIIIHIV